MAEKREKRYVSDDARLMAEWDWEKNDSLGFDPHKITCGSEKRAWWICNKGHEWQALVSSRSRGHGCPFCSGRYAIPGENDLQTINPFLAQEWNYEKNNGLLPVNVLPSSNKKVWWVCNKGHEWLATISGRNGGTGCPICYSERNTSFPEYALDYYLKKCNINVLHTYKDNGYELDIYIPAKNIAIEYDGYYWHKNKTKKDLEKNKKCHEDGITLYRIREGLPPLHSTSIDLVIDEQQSFNSIIKKLLFEINGTTIDIDINRDTIAIESLRIHSEKNTSLLFSNPEIANEWNYEKNGVLRPENFHSNSEKNVWWKCSKGHEWQATIASRNSKGNGCPYCANRKIMVGFNDLQTTNPSLANEWNYQMNRYLSPYDVISNSAIKVWWKCSKNHEWQATIISRNRGNGCPYCANQKVMIGFNDLQTTNPHLANEWNYQMNRDLLPSNVVPNSGIKVWWKCSKGHEWQATIKNRHNGNDCPYCSGRYTITGENDLLTINPILASEWNYERNGQMIPSVVSPNSDKKVWWKCGNGHEWQATIYSRNQGHGCPNCTGHYTKRLTPEEYTKRLGDKHPNITLLGVYTNTRDSQQFLCNDCGTIWTAKLKTMLYGSGCPKCTNKKK